MNSPDPLNSAKFFRDSIRRMSDAIAALDRVTFDAEVNLVLDMAVPLIRTGQSDVLGEVLPDLQKLYGETLVSLGEVDRDDAAMGKLSVLVSLFSMASPYLPAGHSADRLMEDMFFAGSPIQLLSAKV